MKNLNIYIEDAKRTEQDYRLVVERLSSPHTARLLHAAMGLATEAGEFIDQLKRHIFYGKPLDTVNLIEELGDLSWYQRIGLDELESDFIEMLDRNVAKLHKRFPEKFTEAQALNRDLDAERVALEQDGEEVYLRKALELLANEVERLLAGGPPTAQWAYGPAVALRQQLKEARVALSIKDR